MGKVERIDFEFRPHKFALTNNGIIMWLEYEDVDKIQCINMDYKMGGIAEYHGNLYDPTENYGTEWNRRRYRSMERPIERTIERRNPHRLYSYSNVDCCSEFWCPHTLTSTIFSGESVKISSTNGINSDCMHNANTPIFNKVIRCVLEYDYVMYIEDGHFMGSEKGVLKIVNVIIERNIHSLIYLCSDHIAEKAYRSLLYLLKKTETEPDEMLFLTSIDEYVNKDVLNLIQKKVINKLKTFVTSN